MTQAQRSATAVEALEDMAQASLDLHPQRQGAGDIAGDLAMHLGQRRGAQHGTLASGIEGLRQHGAAAADVVTEQMHEAISVGGTAGPAQQRHLPGCIDLRLITATGLHQPLRQAGGTPRLIDGLAHAQIADHGQCQHDVFQRDGVIHLAALLYLQASDKRPIPGHRRIIDTELPQAQEIQSCSIPSR